MKKIYITPLIEDIHVNNSETMLAASGPMAICLDDLGEEINIDLGDSTGDVDITSAD